MRWFLYAALSLFADIREFAPQILLLNNNKILLFGVRIFGIARLMFGGGIA
jgi:hypothetical protein